MVSPESQQGRYNEAEPLFTRALRIRETKLGPDHPDTAISLGKLAGLFKDQGRYNEAEPLLRRAWEVVRNVLGHHHPSSVQVLKNYLFVLRINGRNTEYKSVLSKYRSESCEGREAGGRREDQGGSETAGTVRRGIVR